MTRSVLLCFLRHHNDIDHIVPALFAFRERSALPIVVALSNAAKLSVDFRLAFLQTLGGVSVRPLMSREASEPPARKTRWPLLKPGSGVTKSGPAVAIQDEIAALFSELNQTFEHAAVILDWVMDNQPDYLPLARAVLEQSRERGWPVLSLPHGDAPHANMLIRRDEFEPEAADIYSIAAQFDHVAVPNEACAQRYRPHVAPERLHVLGSPRYNKRWLSILRSFRPNEELPSGGELKAALFLRHYMYPIFWDEAVRTVRMLAQQRGMTLIVQHHPRAHMLAQLAADYPALRPGEHDGYEVVTDEYSAPSLVEWADICLDCATSIGFEALMQDTCLLSMEYLHATWSMTAKLVPGSAAHCRDHVLEAISALKEDPSARPYSEAERRAFIETMIDVPDANVLDRYGGLLLSQYDHAVVQ